MMFGCIRGVLFRCIGKVERSMFPCNREVLFRCFRKVERGDVWMY